MLLAVIHQFIVYLILADHITFLNKTLNFVIMVELKKFEPLNSLWEDVIL